jgi:hypothetical protein
MPAISRHAIFAIASYRFDIEAAPDAARHF